MILRKEDLFSLWYQSKSNLKESKIFLLVLKIFRSFVFQADSEEEFKDWMKSFEMAKMSSLQSKPMNAGELDKLDHTVSPKFDLSATLNKDGKSDNIPDKYE